MSRIIRLFVLFSAVLRGACEQMSRDIERDLKKDLLQEQQVAIDENKALVHRDFEEVWSQGKLDVIDEIYDTGFVKHINGRRDIHGPEGLKQSVSMFHTNFSDVQFTIEDQIAEGDKVVNRWTFTGTHKGELMGIPPTGVQVTITGIAIYRITGGKIMEIWVNSDALGLMQQLGAVPPLGKGE